MKRLIDVDRVTNEGKKKIRLLQDYRDVIRVLKDDRIDTGLRDLVLNITTGGNADPRYLGGAIADISRGLETDAVTQKNNGMFPRALLSSISYDTVYSSTYFWVSDAPTMKHSPLYIDEALYIRDSPNIVDMTDGPLYLPGVLHIYRCDNFRTFKGAPAGVYSISLTDLVALETLKYMPTLHPPQSSMKLGTTLIVSRCDAFRSLKGITDSVELVQLRNLNRLVSLEYLTKGNKHILIDNCSSLESIKGLPEELHTLTLDSLPSLGPECLKELPKVIKNLNIKNCPHLNNISEEEFREYTKCSRIKITK